jgi:hypothetical protein
MVPPFGFARCIQLFARLIVVRLISIELMLKIGHYIVCRSHYKGIWNVKAGQFVLSKYRKTKVY